MTDRGEKKETHFTGSFDTLYRYWQDEDRAERFTEGGTRAPGIQYILARLETDIHKGVWIDTAVGAGYVQQNLSESVLPNCMIGVDFSKAMLNKINSHPIQRVLGSSFKLPFREESANLTTNIFSLSDYPDIKKALFEMSRVTRTGAIFSHIDYAEDDEYWQKRKSLHGEELVGEKIQGDINLRSLDDIKKVTPQNVRITEQRLIEYDVDLSDTKFADEFKDPTKVRRSFLFSEFYKPRQLENF